jgi:hypothetical protein
VTAVTDPSAAVFKAHPRYRLFTLAAAALAALFVWDLRDGVEIGSAIFLAVCVGLALWYGRAMGSRVEVTHDRVTLYAPLSAPATVEFRQLAGVSEEGRWTQAILLLYHPLADQGLLDLDEIRSLALPAVEEQPRLLATLDQQAPA